MDVGAISSRGLSRAFASGPALVDLDLDVGSGQVLALLGPNGAGKTTTVRLLNGILRPDAGTATVLGLDPWADGEAVRRRTGVLTEQAGLDERFTAMENLVLFRNTDLAPEAPDTIEELIKEGKKLKESGKVEPS